MFINQIIIIVKKKMGTFPKVPPYRCSKDQLFSIDIIPENY
jgi:hypothetical protein